MVVSAGGGATTKMGAWIIPTNGKTAFTISADSVAFEGSPTVLIRESDSFPEYITTVSTFGNAVDAIKAQEGFTKTVNVSSKYVAIVTQVVSEQKITFDNLRITALTYKIPVRLRGKNLLPYPYYHGSRTTNGITYTDNGDGTITASGTATGTAYHYEARITTENMLCEGGKTYTFSWGGVGSSSAYYGFVKVDDAVKTAVATGSVTFTPSVSQYIDVGFLIISGATVNNLVIKPQVELGGAATDYEPYITPQTQTATLTSPLSGGEYIDVINKKRYASDGTATDITVTGELKTIESGSITIDCTTGVQPPRIEAEYWQDINKVVGNLTSAILANGGNA